MIDAALGGLITGDNVVWVVDEPALIGRLRSGSSTQPGPGPSESSTSILAATHSPMPATLSGSMPRAAHRSAARARSPTRSNDACMRAVRRA